MEKEQILKEALFYTNSAYLMADVANTYALEANSKLARLQKLLHKDEKHRFNKAVRILKDAIKTTKEITNPIYQISEVDNACNDSDFLSVAIMELINRTGDSEEEKEAMLEHLRKMPIVEHKEV